MTDRQQREGLTPRRMTLQRLRNDLPHWTWRAERAGFGWEYVGIRDGHTVTVRAYSAVVGLDEYETQWRVNDGGRSHHYGIWSIQQMESPDD